MKNLLSIWSGRLKTLLFPAVLMAGFLVPANVSAYMGLSNGGGDGGGTEGDPLDTNDWDGGGGGSDVQDTNGVTPPRVPFVFQLDRFQILLVPDYSSGTPTFRVLVLKKTESDLAGRNLEGTHAP
jgi:hypothetical protein